MNIYDTWHGQFFSRSGGTHEFTLKLEKKEDNTVASLCLKRATPDPRNEKFEIPFKAHAKVSEENGHQFVALVAQDEEGQLFTTILKAVDDEDVLHGSLVFKSVRTHEIDQERVEWRRTPGQHQTNEWQTWYSTFEGRAGNTNWFTLRLSSDHEEAMLDSITARTDELKTKTNARVHIEKSSPYVALLVKDKNPPYGMVSMILHPDGPGCMRGQMIWNSLTDGTLGTVRVKESREIIWTTLPSSDHPAAKPL